jgi:CheY-like chemotaxis protein/AraC-like DNA-binding protein
VLILGIGFLINYISARQARLEAKLRIAEIEKEKEHDLNEAKIAFFTNISHEFRTPLTLILSPITEMLGHSKIEPGTREKLILIENNANRLLNLINQLLDFRKSEHGLLNLNVERSDFISFAHEVFLSFKDVSRTKKIDYKFESEIDRALLLFDRDKMEIVLCNIISNAFKYSKSGGQIRVHIYLSEEYLKLEVLDNGIGLSLEDATKVFDRFYQVQSSQTAKMVGSGIGLAFTKNIVELHHGNIFVRSVPGKETCFTTQLLLDNTHLKAQEPSPNEILHAINGKDYPEDIDPNWVNQNSLEIDTDTKKETVLVVDDNDDIRKYLRSLLKDDYKVIEAENGLVGLAMAKSEQPDIIVSDIMMPEMDGITFCQEIKSQIVTSHIPIILLTARTSVVYEVNGLETGADDYVTKPFNPVIMKTRIHNILENRKKLRGYFLNRVRFEPDNQEVAEGSSMDEAFIEKAIKLVSDNLANESFGVDLLMSDLCMSQSTLYRKLKSLTGLSITGFIRSVRLKKAAQMILNDDVKLSQVAFEVGFNDYKHFRLSFQHQFGCLPSDYKTEMLENIKKREESI